MVRLTWDLDQKMNTSPTILNSSSASGSGQVSHRALVEGVTQRSKVETNLTTIPTSLSKTYPEETSVESK